MMNDVSVIVYGKEGCPDCLKVNKELEAAEIKYIFRDVELNKNFWKHADEGRVPLVELESRSGYTLEIGTIDDLKEVIDIIQFFCCQ